jgi:hypothetical protein
VIETNIWAAEVLKHQLPEAQGIFDNPNAVCLTPTYVEHILRQAGFQIDATEVMLPGITMLTKARKPG